MRFYERFLIRRVDAGEFLETFLVAAVVAVLAIRLFLELTNYPQIGGDGLHIAHMLWGGVLMLASIVMLLCLMGRAAERVAAILGGFGFGTFIDEVGKFITSDNDYFFRPAVSIIYIVFILIFLLARAVQSRLAAYTPQENLINALRAMEDAAMRDLSVDERRRALALLSKSDATHPLVKDLQNFLEHAATLPDSLPGWYARLKNLAQKLYEMLAGSRWFPPLVILFFIGQLALKLVYAFVLVFFVGLGWDEILTVRVVGSVARQMSNLSFVDAVEIACSLLSGLFVLAGVLLMRRSRLRALRMFERSVLVTIFLQQVFAFYVEQFSALLGLLLNIGIYIALRLVIEQEEKRARVDAK